MTFESRARRAIDVIQSEDVPNTPALRMVTPLKHVYRLETLPQTLNCNDIFNSVRLLLNKTFVLHRIHWSGNSETHPRPVNKLTVIVKNTVVVHFSKVHDICKL